MYTAMLGPGVHANLYGNLSGVVFAELGVEHTGGEQMSPNISFAGGFGGGLTYSLFAQFGRATYRRPRRRIVPIARQ